MEEKKVFYEVYQLWARLLHQRKTTYKKHEMFGFHENTKWSFWNITKEEVDDDDPLPEAFEVDSDNFVKFIVYLVI